jgi:hypothetical protein
LDKRDLERRTKAFALRIIRFVGDLPRGKVTDVVGYQLVKAGTSLIDTFAVPFRFSSNSRSAIS